MRASLVREEDILLPDEGELVGENTSEGGGDDERTEYVRHEVVPMEEDMMVEFKGHRTVSMEDENPKHFRPNEGLA